MTERPPKESLFEAIRGLFRRQRSSPNTADAIEAITVQCRTAAESLGRGKHAKAGKVLDSALSRMSTTEVPVELRARAIYMRGVVHLLAQEYARAIERVRELVELVETQGAARPSLLDLLVHVAELPGDLPAWFVSSAVDLTIECQATFENGDDRARAGQALRAAVGRAVTDTTRTNQREVAGIVEQLGAAGLGAGGIGDLLGNAERMAMTDSASGKALLGVFVWCWAREVQLATWAGRLAEVEQSTVDVQMAVMELWAAAALLGSATDNPLLAERLDDLQAWCDRHKLWKARDSRGAVLGALRMAVDRLKSRAVTAAMADDLPKAGKHYTQAREAFKLVERHYSALADKDAEVAAAVAESAEAIMGADAYLGRHEDARTRLKLIQTLRKQHRDDARIERMWIRAPLRYVISMIQARAPKDEIKVEILKARDRARQHLSSSDYASWREEMRRSVKVSFLDEIGF